MRDDYTANPVALNARLVQEFRAGGGRLGGPLAGVRLLLLTTRGARSGREHTTPLGYVTDGTADRLVLFASNLGAAKPPAWFHNLRANPDATIEVGSERFSGRASVPGGAERDRLYELFTSQTPGTSSHEERAGRPIPMVLIE